ncbi:MAG: hypothetical protein ACYCQK_01375 [Acidiferrobacteraceae bacterium]
MATPTIEVLLGITGLTLTADMYPFGSDTAAFSAVALTEATNRKGLYVNSAAIVNPAGGWYDFVLKSGGSYLGNMTSYVPNLAGTYRIADRAVTVAVGDETLSIPAAASGGLGGLPTVDASNNIHGIQAAQIPALFQQPMTEGYAARGVAPTPEQCIFLVMQALTNFKNVGNTFTALKLDGATAAATGTFDTTSNPTQLIRAT